MTYEIAPSLNWTIFNGGQLVNATRLAKAQLDEAINQFNQTVLTAVQETDNAMNSYRNSIKQIVALREVRNQGIETLNFHWNFINRDFRLSKTYLMHNVLCYLMRIFVGTRFSVLSY